ncbi:MAG TPA: hypothetical protein VGR20_02150, partial [Acidimicrobiia bacterium]|nr:hypothetical protein [Acidimicrobiia bacterium]
MLSIRRSQLGAVALALALVTAGCGSNLTEAQVLARSGVTTPAPSDSTALPGVSGAVPSPGGLTSAESSTATAATSAPGARVFNAGTSLAPSAVRPAGTPNQATSAAKPGAPAVTPSPAAPGGGHPSPPAPPGKPAGGTANGACTTTESGPIVVGNVGNYSGAGGSSQAGFPIAVQMWAASVNRRGGICGRP